ncbi:MAG: serine protease [Treponema sp.]|jgi:serine protease Do|nr:serine protease [Treponema sp.]
MNRRIFLTVAMFFLAVTVCFGQAGALRDYVGLISIHYHPDVVAYMGKFKERFEKKGYTNAAKAIDNYLKGLSGTGFIYVASDGTCYVLTNEHVVASSESLSITFEKQDGSKTVYDRLKVLYVDEEKDLALLVFDAGVKPFKNGLSFNAKAIDEGVDVFAAGFPGLGNTAVWQFSRGNISNVSVRVPKSIDSDETIGPYIQHTAQIDPGNSGGPLLIAAQGVLTGYSVIGINTLSARARQAANYAIPVDQVRTFIDTALSKQPRNEKEFITKKVDEFVKGLNGNKSVYEHIAKFISNNFTASNAEYAISELLDKASRSVLEDIDRTFTSDPVEGMNAAVAWNIESLMRSKTGTIKVSLDSINPNDKGGFDVTFNVNDKIVKSEWSKEYGIYRMDTYGELAAGGKSLMEEKEKKQAKDKALRTDFSMAVFVSYANVFDYDSAVYASIRIGSPFTIGVDLVSGFGDTKYFKWGMSAGGNIPIRLDSIAIIPFFEGGAGPVSSAASKAGEEFGFDFAICLPIRGGLMLTFSAVPGLYGRFLYEYNTIFTYDKNKAIKAHSIIGVGIGYAF